MKKDFVFIPVLMLIGALLFLLRTTGMTAHIAISVVGVLVLAAYTALCKKDWTLPAVEILARVCYGIALISGVIIKIVHGIAALSVIHKAGATLFVVFIVVLFVHKIVASEKA